MLSRREHSSFVTAFHRRRLPPYHAVGQATFVTWRLYGSLPAHRPFPTGITPGQAFLALDRLLDHASTGSLFLLRPAIANLVAEAILYREQPLAHYQLHAWVVMPNHVHLLITPRIPVSKLLQSLKRFTATEANRVLGRTGQPFWQTESYDRLVRNEREFRRIRHYIEMNPVQAGLTAIPEQFPWSSAKGRSAIGPQVATCPTHSGNSDRKM
jgi:putative DNA methylase